MALKTRQNDNIIDPDEAVKTIRNEKVNFDDLIATTEATAEEGYKTITGRETEYLPDYETYKSYEMDVGDWIQGKPEVSIITKDGKNYDALHLRIIDDSAEEILDCYCNYPRADEQGFVTNLTKDFDFYRSAFDFIFSILKTRGDKYVLDKNGEEYNKFRRVDFMGFARLVDTMKQVKVEITEGNPDSTYDSWMIIHME